MSERDFWMHIFLRIWYWVASLQRLLWDNGTWVPLGDVENIAHFGMYGLDGEPFGINQCIANPAPIFAWLARTEREAASGMCVCVWANERCVKGGMTRRLRRTGAAGKLPIPSQILHMWDDMGLRKKVYVQRNCMNLLNMVGCNLFLLPSSHKVCFFF